MSQKEMKYGNIIKIEFLKNIQYTTPCLLNHLFNIRFKKMSLCQRMFLQGVNVRVFKDDRLCQFFSKTHTYKLQPNILFCIGRHT